MAKPSIPYVNPWDTDKTDWENIKIPAKDLMGQPHPPVTHNKHEFAPGKNYFVPAAIAREVESMLDKHASSVRRLLSNELDFEAIATVMRQGRVPADI
jgi:hypothetical protein